MCFYWFAESINTILLPPTVVVIYFYPVFIPGIVVNNWPILVIFFNLVVAFSSFSDASDTRACPRSCRPSARECGTRP